MEHDSDGVTRREVLEFGAVAGIAVAQLGASDAMAQPAAMVSIAEYIALRLKAMGCAALFGIPGATCDPMFEAAQARGMRLVITASDLEAGYAADGYARLRGLGAVCVTYGVGTLSLIAAIAGAYVERSPVVILNGGPTGEDLRRYQTEETLFSHGIGAVASDRTGQPVTDDDLLGDLALFRRVTAHQVRITRAADAPQAIDRALAAARLAQRPVYIEVSKALWSTNVPMPGGNPAATAGVAGEAGIARSIIERLRVARRPLLMLGEQISRHGLTDAATALVTKLGIPFVTTHLGKTVVSEQSALFAGVHRGPSSPPMVERLVDEADCIVALGCSWGRQYRSLVGTRIGVMMQVAGGRFRDGRSAALPADLRHTMSALQATAWTVQAQHSAGRTLARRSFAARRESFSAARPAVAGAGLTYDGLIATVSAALAPGLIAMVDTCLAQYPAADLDMPVANSFLSNAIWNAIGFTPAAAVGVGVAGQETGDRRPLVICGDGGFQMTAQALSTLARQRIRAIVLILDNALYAIEQKVVEDTRGIAPNSSRSYFSNPAQPPIAHLALARWDYVGLARAMGVETAVRVETADALGQALADAMTASGPVVISVAMNPRSLPGDLWS